jgi:catechol 2,3-dioxygenase-like lactoylglutathione lyase family enzyme
MFMRTALKIRVARPSNDLSAAARFYVEGLGLKQLAQFKDHAGIDGVIFGHENAPYHFELTRHLHSPVIPRPTPEDLIVFYIPDEKEWTEVTARLENSGFHPVPSLNPYWDQRGRTYVDLDGYRVVIQNAEWNL